MVGNKDRGKIDSNNFLVDKVHKRGKQNFDKDKNNLIGDSQVLHSKWLFDFFSILILQVMLQFQQF